MLKDILALRDRGLLTSEEAKSYAQRWIEANIQQVEAHVEEVLSNLPEECDCECDDECDLPEAFLSDEEAEAIQGFVEWLVNKYDKKENN